MTYHEDTSATGSNDAQSRSQTYRHLRRLLETFPSDQAVALWLIESDARFRETCEEYEACNEAVERLAHTKFDEDLRKEYSALQLQLEGELLRRIVAHGSKRSQC